MNNQICTKCGESGHFFGQHDLYCAVCDEQYYHNTEGQLISECLFDNLKFSKKNNEKFDKFLPQNIKSGQINKIKVPSYNI